MEEPKNVLVENLKKEKVEIIYANAFVVTNNLFETNLQFFIETTDAEKHTYIKEQIADIRLSPQLAKVLKSVMNETITEYESKIGLIPTQSQK